jgi:hypothetical protein
VASFGNAHVEHSSVAHSGPLAVAKVDMKPVFGLDARGMPGPDAQLSWLRVPGPIPGAVLPRIRTRCATLGNRLLQSQSPYRCAWSAGRDPYTPRGSTAVLAARKFLRVLQFLLRSRSAFPKVLK